MSMSEQDKYWHKMYESLKSSEQGVVHSAFNAVYESLQADGMITSMDDRAEQLIAAITRYMMSSIVIKEN